MIIYILNGCDKKVGPRAIKDRIRNGIQCIRCRTKEKIYFGFTHSDWVLVCPDYKWSMILPASLPGDPGMTADNLYSQWSQKDMNGSEWPARIGPLELDRIDFAMGVMIDAGIWEEPVAEVTPMPEPRRRIGYD